MPPPTLPALLLRCCLTPCLRRGLLLLPRYLSPTASVVGSPPDGIHRRICGSGATVPVEDALLRLPLDAGSGAGVEERGSAYARLPSRFTTRRAGRGRLQER